MNQHLQIKNIAQASDRTLSIVWTDGNEQLFDVVDLRRKCPCAGCIDEWTRKPLLKAEDVNETVRPTNVYSVGRYAVGFKFNDGHTTGIYTYDLLHKLGKPATSN